MVTVERIEELCIENKITVAELERRVGLGNGVIRRWKERTPASDKLNDIADYFKVSTDYLLGRTDNPNMVVLDGEDIPVKYKKQLEKLDVEMIEIAKEAVAEGLTAADFRELLRMVKKIKKSDR
jgi:transcriptional regulator with XRE-family HTH domain